LSLREGAVARALYLAAAQGTAWLYALSGKIRSAGARRSVGPGEIYFGRSDIDLELVLKPGSCGGRSLGFLYRVHRIIRALNPALGHIWVMGPSDIALLSEWDTVWGSMEKQCYYHLYGSREMPTIAKIRSEDALRSFLLWFDLYVPAAVQRHDIRNCKKHALECWNFFAVAEGLLERPLVTRHAMEQHLRCFHKATPDLDAPQGLMRFILDLAQQLHSKRMEPLPRRLGKPKVFQAVAAPHGITRTYVVLPTPEYPLPDEAYLPGSFIATPELLDLYLQYKNGFLHWIAPEELGLKPPTAAGFLRDLRHYCSPHFLRFPGFVEGGRALDPGVKFEYLSHAFDSLKGGRLPRPPSSPYPQQGITDIEGYYRYGYDSLKARTDELVQQLGIALESAP